MPKQKLWLIALIIGSLGLIVLFLQLPKLPDSVTQKVTTMDPDSLKLQQAIELVNGADPMAGIMQLRELVAKDSTNVDAHYYLGLFSVKSGQLDKAIDRFRRVLALRPDDIKYQVEVGYQFMLLDTAELALPCFERGLQIDSTDNNSLFFSAQALERMNRFAEAKRNYETLLRHNTDSIVSVKVTELIDSLNKKLNP
ncbi:MAG: tetratricopeptide repeat protein [Flavobacteriales bacterium]|nr:tetratricopeptide repeat protein [Flavobacteriales bacterium]